VNGSKAAAPTVDDLQVDGRMAVGLTVASLTVGHPTVAGRMVDASRQAAVRTGGDRPKDGGHQMAADRPVVSRPHPRQVDHFSSPVYRERRPHSAATAAFRRQRGAAAVRDLAGA
jgi:hypothetical protein